MHFPLPEIGDGIDMGCYRHAVAIGRAKGDILDEFSIHHRRAQWQLIVDVGSDGHFQKG